MKQYTFKDGVKVIATSVAEAKSKHKALAYTDELGKLLEEIGILGKGNIRYEYGGSGMYKLVLNAEKKYDFNGMRLGYIKKVNNEYIFKGDIWTGIINKKNSRNIKNCINACIEVEIDIRKEELDYLKSFKF